MRGPVSPRISFKNRREIVLSPADIFLLFFLLPACLALRTHDAFGVRRIVVEFVPEYER